MDAVSEILVDRSRELGGLERMIGASLMAHVALVAVVVLAPAWWFGGASDAEPEAVMTISLGGPEGPNVGGMTTIGGRPIQTETVEARKTIEPVRPPAARAPEMIEPKKAAPKKAEAKVDNTAKDPKGRTPTKGAEVRQGSSVVETGARGQGFGLASGGFGAGSYLDVANFCCPEYLTTMLSLIRNNWQENQQAAGLSVVKFTIQRDGALTNVQVERSSGYPALDFMAQRSILITRQIPPLPSAFTEPSLTVHLVFEYRR
jgi:TonB family protein